MEIIRKKLTAAIDIWGFRDVEAAVASIPSWIERFGWTGYGVYLESWLVSGHSNGGKYTGISPPAKL